LGKDADYVVPLSGEGKWILAFLEGKDADYVEPLSGDRKSNLAFLEGKDADYVEPLSGEGKWILPSPGSADAASPHR
jgi:hypothetical protein